MSSGGSVLDVLEKTFDKSLDKSVTLCYNITKKGRTMTINSQFFMLFLFSAAGLLFTGLSLRRDANGKRRKMTLVQIVAFFGWTISIIASSIGMYLSNNQ